MFLGAHICRSSDQCGSRLAKVNIEAAYHLILVLPMDRPLKATSWEGKMFIAVADALEWYLKQQEIRYIYH